MSDDRNVVHKDQFCQPYRIYLVGGPHNGMFFERELNAADLASIVMSNKGDRYELTHIDESRHVAVAVCAEEVKA